MLGRSGKGRQAGAGRRRGNLPLTYYRSKSRGDFADSPFKKKPKVGAGLRSFISRFVDVFLIVAITVGIVYSLIVRPQSVLSVDSSIYHAKPVYLAALKSELGALKNRNKITFDEGAVISALQKQFPEIQQGFIELPLFGQKPKVSLHIAPPALILSSGSSKYIIDKKGTAVAVLKDLPKIGELPLVIDQSGFAAAKGKQVLSSSEVSFIDDVVAQTQRSKVTIASLILPPRPQEVDLKTTDRSYFVKFYLGGDPTLQTGQFLAARHQFDQSGNQPSEYLDVRVKGKIYYK